VIVKFFCLIGLGCYVVLSCLDFVLTFALIRLSDGMAYEANPIAALCLDELGWGGLAAFKLALVTVFVGTVGYVMVKRKWIGAVLAVYGCSMMLGVVLYSQDLIAETRHEIANRSPAWGAAPKDPLKEPYLGLFAQR
jgi:hypothetical protein